MDVRFGATFIQSVSWVLPVAGALWSPGVWMQAGDSHLTSTSPDGDVMPVVCAGGEITKDAHGSALPGTWVSARGASSLFPVGDDWAPSVCWGNRAPTPEHGRGCAGRETNTDYSWSIKEIKVPFFGGGCRNFFVYFLFFSSRNFILQEDLWHTEP